MYNHITTDDERVIREMTTLYNDIKTRANTPSPPRVRSEKTFEKNKELIYLFKTNPHKTRQGLADRLDIKPSNITNWIKYKTSKVQREVPKKHMTKIYEYFRM